MSSEHESFAPESLEMTAAIFDCDGILVDSERPWIALMHGYLDRLGACEVPAERFRGLSAAEAVAALAQVSAGAGPLPTVDAVDRAYSAALTDLAAPMPGAPELVATMAGTIPIAVASNGRREDVQGLLARAGLLECFDAIITVEDVGHGKPCPDIYLRAASEIGVSSASATAFEDSRVGSQAAHAAGCTVVGINADPRVPLVSAIRLTEMGQLGFDAGTRTLHIVRPVIDRSA